jgi:Putative beta-barrel porin 2
MNGAQNSMLCEGLIRSRKFVARSILSALFLIAWIPLSFAQMPPLDVPINRLPATDPNAIAVGGWLLYPTLRLYSLYSDNLFLTPTSPLSVPGFGVTPSMTAEWSNGIHATTLYGNIDSQTYPTDNDVNTFDRRAGFTQKYEAMRDLIFSVNADYTHQTWATGLQNSIQTATVAPATTVLANGNTVLPNGTILSPSGQVIGQTNPATGSGLPLFVDPFDKYTGTFSVEKIFNRGILDLSGSVSRTDYENQSSQNAQTSPNFSRRTFTEHAAVWLGPLFYAYSDGSIGTFVPDATSASTTSTPTTSTPTTSYRVIGGLGTRQFGLFQGSAYFGHQGSEGSTTAEGDVYGGALSYYPTPKLTFTGSVDETINISSQASATNLALTLPGLTALQVPLGASTRITSTSLKSSYEITPQWFTSLQLAYTRIEYIDSTRLDNSWIVDGIIRYDIWRNMSLTWEYRYRSVVSNAPLTSANSNYVTMGATYKY